MPSTGTLLALAGVAASAQAAFQGFNYGNTFTDGSIKAQSDYEAEFKNAAGLEGTNGAFNSARLYTMIQGGTTNDPNAAIPAGIKTKISLLFGLWASAGQESFDNEIAALKNTIDQYCDQLDGLVAGISVGSEDLYRASALGQAAGEDPGADPDVLVSYIKQVRDTVKGSCLSDAPIGHVDTWTAYVDGANQPVIEALDWLGMDAYPYFEDTKSNPISEGKNLFQSALEKTQGVAGGRDVWITETGWPVSGKTTGQGVPSLKNAKTYWDEVGCPMFGNTNVWWYTMQDAAPETPNPSFGIIGSDLTEKPLYDLSCADVDTEPSKKPTTTKDKPTSPAKTTTKDEPEPTTTKAEPTTETTSEEAQTTTESSAAASSSEASTTSAEETSVTSENSTTVVPTTTGNTTTVAPSTSPGGVDTSTVVQPPPSTTDDSDGSSTSETNVPDQGGKLNSFGAAAAAIVIAVAVL